MRTLLTKSLAALAMLAACSGDPNDPKTWAKKLKDIREQKAALDTLAKMDVERAREVVPDIMALYQETGNPEHLQALARYKDPRTKPLLVAALDYTDESFDKAVIAAGVLGEMKATDAVDKLIAALEKPLPIKSRANQARLEAMRALVKIGDKKAVEPLTKVLTTSADEQDFLLNQKAALALAEMRDPAAVPALIKGMFMTGRGTDIFQECRLALVRIGDPAIPALVELFQEKNADIRAMAKERKFDEVTPGVVPKKAAYVLGDLKAAQAVPLLSAKLKSPAKGDEHPTIAAALGLIGTPAAVDTLIEVLRNPKADAVVRVYAADALYMTGDKRAIPVLMEIAKTGYVTVDGEKASDLRAAAAIDLARLAGPEHYAAFKALREKETEAEGPFAEALDRMQVAKDCGTDLGCYAKMLNDPAPPRAEKAALAIGFSGDKKALPHILAAMKPLVSVPQERYGVHQALLFSLGRLGDQTCKECVEKLNSLLERDEKAAARLPNAKKLITDARITLAQIQNADPNRKPTLAAAVPAEEAEPAPAAKGKGKKKAAKAKGKGKRR